MGAHQSARSGSVDWLTPPEWIADLGPFGLDPCTPEAGMPWRTAKRMLKPSDNGLTADWGQNFVWLNPPYGPPKVIEPWMRKMADHGNGIALIFARTDTACWHEYVFACASAILFVRGRPHFHDATGKRAAANCGAPVALVGYGPEAEVRLARSGIAGRLVRP
jgi:hypothetical protein